MSSNIKLVNKLIQDGVLKSHNIIEGFKNIDRKNFLTEENKKLAYTDKPLPIGYGQTISQPTTVAFMLELLNPKAGDNILDIGSGSGWTTALLSYIVGKKGYVQGLERIDELVEFGNNNIKKYKPTNAEIQKAGKELGIHGKQFDKILVSAAYNRVPNELIDQLNIGGTMVIPVKNSVYRIKKESIINYSKEEYPNFMFVPLIKDI